MVSLEKTLVWIVRGGLCLLLFIPLIVAQNLFFPFITGKNFFFRIVVEIIFGAWLALGILFPQYRPKRGPLLWALGTFLFIISLASFLGADPYHSFWSNYERMEGLITHIHVFAIFLVAATSLRGLREWGYLLSASIAISAITAVHGILQGTGAIEIVGGGRPHATFGNSIYLATYLMFHLYLIAFFFNLIKNTPARAALAAVFIFDLIAFLFSSSRGEFIGFIMGFLIVSLGFLFTSRGWKYRLGALTILACITGVFIVIFVFPNSKFVRNYDLLTRLSNISLEKLSQEPRIMIWEIAWEGIKERPLLGWGPENFIIVYGKYYNSNLYGNEPWFDRAHNMLLEWLVASGIIGFVAYLATFLAALYTTRILLKRQAIDTISAFLILGLFSAYIIQNAFVFDNVMTYTVLWLIFAFLHSLYTLPSHLTANSNTKKTFSPLRLTSAACALILSVVFIATLNVKPLLAAGGIIDMLQEFGRKGTNAGRITEKFDRVIAYNTFGTTEARERFADTIVEAATQFNGREVPPEVIKIVDRAITELEKESQAQPYTAKYQIFLGKLYTILRNWTGGGGRRGEEAYEKAFSIAPNYVQIYLGLAEFYLVIGERAKAAQAAERAFQIPTSPNTKAALFFPVLSVKVLAGEFRDAERFLKNYYDQNQNWPLLIGYTNDENLKLLVDRSLVSSNDPEGRLSYFRLLESKLDHPSIYLGLAQSYGALGKISEAEKYVRKALEIDPSLKGQLDPEFLRLIDHLP